MVKFKGEKTFGDQLLRLARSTLFSLRPTWSQVNILGRTRLSGVILCTGKPPLSKNIPMLVSASEPSSLEIEQMFSSVTSFFGRAQLFKASPPLLAMVRCRSRTISDVTHATELVSALNSIRKPIFSHFHFLSHPLNSIGKPIFSYFHFLSYPFSFINSVKVSPGCGWRQSV